MPSTLSRARRGFGATAAAVIAAILAAILAGCSAGPIGGQVAGMGAPTQTGAIGGPAAPLAEADGAKPAQTRRTAKVAVLLPLSGAPQVSAVAKGLKQAAELALFDLDSPTVQLIVKDDKGTPEGAAAAAEEAVRAGAELIVGPLFSRSVAAVAPVARAAKIPVVAFSNDRQVAGNGVFLLSYLPDPDVERIVGYAASQGRRGFTALVSQDTYGAAIEATFRAAVARHGGTVVAVERYAGDNTGLHDATRRLGAAIKASEQGAAPADSLFIPGGEDIVPQLGPLLVHAGIDVSRIKLLGTGGWDYPNVGRDAALVGAWYPGPDPRGWQGFTERFSKTYGGPPPRLAPLAYDAVSLATALSGRPVGQRYTTETLTAPTGFNGVDGALRLMPSGLIDRNLAILEVQKFGVTVVEPAAGASSSGPTVALPVPMVAAEPTSPFRPVASAPAPTPREILPETN